MERVCTGKSFAHVRLPERVPFRFCLTNSGDGGELAQTIALSMAQSSINGNIMGKGYHGMYTQQYVHDAKPLDSWHSLFSTPLERACRTFDGGIVGRCSHDGNVFAKAV